MIRYLVAIYILGVLLVSGMAKNDLGKSYFQIEKRFLDHALDFDLLKFELLNLKSASNKMLVAQIKETEAALPPNLSSFSFKI